MTSEQRVTLIKRLVGVLLFIAVVVAVWYFEPEKLIRPPKDQAEKREIKEPGNKQVVTANVQAKAPDRPPTEPADRGPKPVPTQYKRVTILHCHLPGNPASEQMADVFNSVQKKYGNLVTVIRAGFPAQPVDWQKQKGISLPYVIMIVGSENAYHFQGLMPLSQVEKKVEELIFGVRRVGKDWRPVVPGMSPKNH